MSDPGALARRPGVLLAAIETACATLEAARHRIDDLNVFPGPDGDTGRKMARTAQAARMRSRRSGRLTATQGS